MVGSVEYVFVSRVLRGAAIAAWLIFAASQAGAVPISFEADYVTTSAEECGGFIECEAVAPEPPFQKTFTLDSAQLGVDGSYDVSSSLSPTFELPALGPFDPEQPFQKYIVDLTEQVHALVAGGKVTDLVIQFSVDAFDPQGALGVSTHESFQASDGRFSTDSGTFYTSMEFTSDSAGTYSIAQVPESSTALLLASGVVGLAATRRKARRPRPAQSWLWCCR